MAKAAKVLASMGAEAIDINMGCPQHRLSRHGEGAALMNNPEKAAAIVSAVKNAAGLPVSVKMRAGYDEPSVKAGYTAERLAKTVEKAGADMIVIHPRLKSQMFSGMPDHSITLRVRKAVDIPVVANGNLDNPSLAKEVHDKLLGMCEEKGLDKACAGVMLSRGIRGRPGLLSQMERFLTSGERWSSDLQGTIRTIRRHTQYSIQCYGEQQGIKEMRRHLPYYIKGLPCSKKLSAQVINIENMESLEAWLNEVEQCEHNRDWVKSK